MELAQAFSSLTGKHRVPAQGSSVSTDPAVHLRLRTIADAGTYHLIEVCFIPLSDRIVIADTTQTSLSFSEMVKSLSKAHIRN
jgi:hypothetical protein